MLILQKVSIQNSLSHFKTDKYMIKWLYNNPMLFWLGTLLCFPARKITWIYQLGHVNGEWSMGKKSTPKFICSPLESMLAGAICIVVTSRVDVFSCPISPCRVLLSIFQHLHQILCQYPCPCLYSGSTMQGHHNRGYLWRRGHCFIKYVPLLCNHWLRGISK